MAQYGLVFPGQGAQYPGMGRDLYREDPAARAVYDEAGEVLGRDIAALCFAGPQAALDLTANTQIAILTTEIAALSAFSRRVGHTAPLVLAGHSVGEYAALYAAGALGLRDVLSLVQSRGLFHQEAVPVGQGAMAAIIGLAPEETDALCRGIDRPGHVVALAIDNAPGQAVVSGHTAAVAELVAAAERREGVRAVVLPVSVPCHCRLLQEAATRFEGVLGAVRFQDCRIPVIPNCDPEARHGQDQTPALLLRQIVSPVRWRETVAQMVLGGVDTLVEIGPRRILAGLIRRIDRRLRLLNVEDPVSLEKAVAALGG